MSAPINTQMDQSALDAQESNTPTPPGFPHMGKQDEEYVGEALRAGSGTLSAPPPPGFYHDAEERTRRANQVLWTEGDETGETNESMSDGGSGFPFDKRTTSFTNLAAVVGTGLAESMDDSTREQILAEGQHSFDPSHNLSYVRQTRHTASRLIGSTSSPGGYQPGSSSSAAAGPLRSSLIPPTYPQKKKVPGKNGELPSVYPLQDSPIVERSLESSPASNHELPPEFRTSAKLRQLAAMDFYSTAGGSPAPRDFGLTVMEPIEVGRSSAPPQLFGTVGSSRQSTPVSGESRQGTPDLVELQRNLQKVNVDAERQSARGGQSSGSPSLNSDLSLQQTSEAELEPFLWDVHQTEPSRGLAIIGAHSLHVPDVRSTCEAFGGLEVFRADFSDRGILFIGYYDIRSAQYAALELKPCLQRLAAADKGDCDPDVKYCVPVNASSPQDESLVVLSDLPPNTEEDRLASMLSTYGAVRSLSRQVGSRYGGTLSYVVEYYNVQDAKQALLELGSAQPWGPDVLVEVGARTPSDRKKGRELLGLIGRWRHSNVSSRRNSAGSHGSRTTPPPPGHGSSGPVMMEGIPRRGETRLSPTPPPRGGAPSHSPTVPPSSSAGSHMSYPSAMRVDSSDAASASTRSQQTTQLVLGPDGQYSYVVMNRSAYPQSHVPSPAQHIDHHGGVQVVPQQIVHHGPHGSYVPAPSHHPPPPPHGQPAVHYWPHQGHPHPYHGPGATVYLDEHSHSGSGTSVPYYAHVINAPTDSSVSSESATTNLRARQAAPDENRRLMLDIEGVESGRDTRTSLMVRNIPNKYTQQMLLSEFTEHGLGPGKIDFFYLPIDFKNKCNRGYAFINFVDCRDIVTFHRQYFGKHWKIFNSDKICDITYARIQGKQGMLKRFENSALMEKDDGYKPLVFVSSGPDQGARIPFPSSGADVT